MNQQPQSSSPKLIVMLTHNDRTVQNASEIFEAHHDAAAEYWGMKEDGIPFYEMKKLYARMKACGKTTVLEVVDYSEDGCLDGVRMAIDCNCDILMGTMFFDSVNDLCQEADILYMPFVGDIHGRPSVLEGSAEQMLSEAERYVDKGAYGIDLLGYRYTGNAVELNKKIVSKLNAPVCLAGSVNGFERLEEVKACNPWAFTIGGAFFEGRFGGDFGTQIDKVCEFMNA